MKKIYDALDFLFEADYSDITAKQANVYKLFPKFAQRIKEIISNGGLRLEKASNVDWLFRVNSGTMPGKSYEYHVEWKDFAKQLGGALKTVPKTKSGRPNLVQAARSMVFEGDLNMNCSCPAFKYWGPAYIMSKMDAKWGKKENRPPVVRNPNEYGAVCKHGQLVLRVLPFYISNMATRIKESILQEVKFIEPSEEELSAINKMRVSTRFRNWLFIEWLFDKGLSWEDFKMMDPIEKKALRDEFRKDFRE